MPIITVVVRDTSFPSVPSLTFFLFFVSILYCYRFCRGNNYNNITKVCVYPSVMRWRSWLELAFHRAHDARLKLSPIYIVNVVRYRSINQRQHNLPKKSFHASETDIRSSWCSVSMLSQMILRYHTRPNDRSGHTLSHLIYLCRATAASSAIV